MAKHDCKISTLEDGTPPRKMGKTSTFSVHQNLQADDPKTDSGFDDSVSLVMRIALITDKIFSNLSLKDLLNCSQVNRSWQEHTRRYIRNKTKCLAFIPIRKSCKSFKELDHLLRNSRHIPFNGFNVSTRTGKDDHNCVGDKLCMKLVPKVFSSLLNSVQVKYLQLTFSQSIRRGYYYDPVANFVREVFMRQAEIIIEISLPQIPTFPERISRVFGFHTNLKKHWLPNLRELHVPHDVDYSRRSSYMIREFISSSPHLHHMIKNQLL